MPRNRPKSLFVDKPKTIGDLYDKFADHDAWERTRVYGDGSQSELGTAAAANRLREEADERGRNLEKSFASFATSVGTSIITLNHEMGTVQGELKLIRQLLTVLLGFVFTTILGGLASVAVALVIYAILHFG